MRRAPTALAVAVVAAGLAPGIASAHVGVTAPAATSYLARIASAPSGIEARIVDGDQRLWLRAPASLRIVVIGLRGEPYLRFSPRGIEVNTRSETYFLNRSRPALIPHGLTATTPPDWRPVTSAHSTSWHEDRLHALALAAHRPGTRYLGRWLVPLTIDGRRATISGGLWWAPRPSLLWFWPLALLVASLPALLRLRDAGPRAERVTAWILGGTALAASTLARLGRELYGRPSVSTGQLALAAATCLVALVLAILWAHADWRAVSQIAIAVLAFYQGLALWGTLRHAYVLSVLPPWLERGAASVCLAAGIALAVVVLAGSVSSAASQAEDAEELLSLERAQSRVGG